MARVFEGERTFLTPVLGPVERGLYRIAGIDETREQHWITYTVAMLLFNAAGFLLLYALAAASGGPAASIRQACRPSRRTSPSTPRSASPPTPTGRTTAAKARCPISTQMVGLTNQNFVSAATGIALAVALIRGFARASAKTVGNFWVDLTRCTLYVLLPICIVSALVPGLAGRAAEARRLMSTRPRSKAPSRPSPWPGRLADRHQACSAPMAAAS